MSTIYDLLQKVNGKGLYLMQYGYEEIPAELPFFFDLKDLNTNNLDFRSAKLKNIVTSMTMSETGDAITWYEDDLKQAKVTISTVNSTTSFDVDSSDIQVWELLRNQNTDKTYVVVAVSTNTITIDAADASAAVDNVLVRTSHAKKYAADHGFVTSRNALGNYSNYFQFIEEQIPSDMITNNQLRLFLGDQELAKSKFSDASRHIMKWVAESFYVWKKAKTNVSGSYIYSAGWLMDFIPSDSKGINIKGWTNTETKENLRNQLTLSLASWLAWISGNKKLMWMSTSKFCQEVDGLYEEKMIFNDTLKAVDVWITSIKMGWRTMHINESNVMNDLFWDRAVSIAVPVDYVASYMLPNGATDATGKAFTKMWMWYVYEKPKQTYESSTIALATTYSWMFKGVSSWAYRQIEIA